MQTIVVRMLTPYASPRGTCASGKCIRLPKKEAQELIKLQVAVEEKESGRKAAPKAESEDSDWDNDLDAKGEPVASDEAAETTTTNRRGPQQHR